MRTTARGAIWATALLVASSCFAQTSGYPTRPVKVIVPFPAGGATDVIVRLITQKLSVSLGQQFYAENHAGAGGNIGMGMAASAPADGYTMLAVTNSFILNPSLYARIPYDPIRDFSPLTLTATSPYVVAVHPSLPARSVGELIALRETPIPANTAMPRLAWARPGISPASCSDRRSASTSSTCPSTAARRRSTSTIAGHTPVSFTALPTAAPHVKDGKLRALAVMSTKRAAAPARRADHGGGRHPRPRGRYRRSGMVVRSETPDDIAQRLHGEIVKALVAAPEVRQRLSALGFEPVGNTPAEFAAWLKAQIRALAPGHSWRQHSESGMIVPRPQRENPGMKASAWACRALLVAGASLAQPSDYPNRPVKVIAPFAPGGPVDIVARVLAPKSSERLGQQFYVENHPGGSGNIGTAMAAKAPADGYTILVISSTLVVNPSLSEKLGFDTTKRPRADLAHRHVAADPAGEPDCSGHQRQGAVAWVKASPGQAQLCACRARNARAISRARCSSRRSGSTSWPFPSTAAARPSPRPSAGTRRSSTPRSRPPPNTSSRAPCARSP